MDSPQTTAKLRLMCSYGGHILPRPGTHSLFYAGGDTRILSIHRHTLATLSSFHSHLSTLLSLKYPFTLKYQLPHLHLDSLISLFSDEDLHILVDEHHCSSSRIRLFVFPTFRHPKSESWFLDALKSSSIMQDSLPLDTASSFTSTSSSSASFTSLLPPPFHSLQSDTTVSSTMSHRQNICCQDPVLSASEAKLNAKTVQVERPNFQFVQSATHFLPLRAPLNSLPSSNQVYHQPPPSKHLLYQTNHRCPLYLVPVTLPITASTQASINLNVSSANSHVPHSYNSHNHSTHPETTAFVHVPCNQNQEPQTYQFQSQNISMESPESVNELDNNLTRDQIYKSQPPPPALPS